MFQLSTQNHGDEALRNLMNAATRTDATAFGLAVKVSGNTVLNWMYADANALKSIAALKGEVTFKHLDNPRFNQTLRELMLSLSPKTPFIALMMRYEGNGDKAISWEFVDLDFLKNLSA
ncbi:MAG: hypothetical protein HN855_15450 [Anaerolineae bacterium]|mgnify:CR=1 FL=1|jgi:hypothetical protein|nr:hypothetical protein [Anaerolineae bacterium]MBT7326552.1 hypothetical protein [Anaerolineae bacterium]